jgi:hypothetical protein
MVKIFIDTNLFLGLYDSDEDPMEIFGDVEAVHPSLIFPDMVFDEFVRNRDRILDRYGKMMKNHTIQGPDLPFFLQRLPAFPTLDRVRDEYNLVVQAMASDVQQMIVEADTDPIFDALSRLYSDPAVTVIRRTDAHIDRARQRKLIGNPPKSDRKETIGDELIWEMILDHVRDDLILVTRDATYRNHGTFLIREFHEKIGFRLSISETISGALRTLGIEPSGALLRFEGEQKPISE